MQIGFSINEILCLATLATGACRLAAARRTRRRPARSLAPEGALPRKPFWVSWGAELFVVIALVFTCRVAVADWPRVPSGSMEPTLRVGDYLLVNHLAYGPRLPFTNTAIEWGQPQRGDVVVFRYPPDVSQFYVKRLIGVPGDVVEFRDGAVRIGGQPFGVTQPADGTRDEDMGQWLVRETVAGRSRSIKINPFVQGRAPLDLALPVLAAACRSSRAGAWTCRVPAGQYLMLGDNRDNSADSRVWGFLPHEQVYGKAVRVLFNWHEPRRFWQPL